MLDVELATRARRVRIRARRLSSALFAGAFESAFKGRGMEFDQVREYQPGDDVRRIDWNVTARAHHGETTRAFVKEHRVERELTVIIMVDMSGSGTFGSGLRTKNEVAAELAAVLAFAAMAGNDRVGVCVFTDRVERYVPPRKGRTHVARIIRELLTFTPVGRGTDIASALAYLERVQRRRAVVFVISDFLQRSAVGRNPERSATNASGYLDELKAVAHHHEVVALRPFDVRERVLPNVGLITLRDAETGEVQVIDTSDERVRSFVTNSFDAREKALADEMRALDVPLLTFATDGPYIDTLIRFFRARTRW